MLRIQIRHTSSFIKNSTIFNGLVTQRNYNSLALGINAPKLPHEPINHQVRKDLRFNPILQYIQQNPIKRSALREKITKLQKFIGSDYSLNDEILSIILHPFDQQHYELNINGKKVLIDVDSIEKIGKDLFQLTSCIFLMDILKYDIDGYLSLDKEFSRKSKLNHYLQVKNLLKIPLRSSNHLKALHIEKSRRILFRILGFVNLIHGKASCTTFINETIINGEDGIFQSVLASRH